MPRLLNYLANWGKVILCLECLLAILLAMFIDIDPAASKGFEITLGVINLGGFFSLGVGSVLYLCGALLSACGYASMFWRTFVPPTIGLPIIVWGFAKLQDQTNIATAVAFLAASIILAILIAARTSITGWHPLPAILPVAFLLTADINWSGWLNVPIGTILIVVPFALKLIPSVSASRSALL